MTTLGPWIARRLLPEHVEKVQSIQPRGSWYEHEYAHHEQWLVQALGDLRQGVRIGYGLFDGNGGLVASVILKRGTYSSELELKNFITNPSLGPEGRSRARAQLLTKVEALCESRGFEKMETEIPATAIEEVSFFLQHHFVVLTARESRYRPQSILYTLGERSKSNITEIPSTTSRW